MRDDNFKQSFHKSSKENRYIVQHIQTCHGNVFRKLSVINFKLIQFELTLQKKIPTYCLVSNKIF